MIAEPTYEYISDRERQIEQTVEILKNLAAQTVLLSEELAQLVKSQEEQHKDGDTNTFAS